MLVVKAFVFALPCCCHSQVQPAVENATSRHQNYPSQHIQPLTNTNQVFSSSEFPIHSNKPGRTFQSAASKTTTASHQSAGGQQANQSQTDHLPINSPIPGTLFRGNDTTANRQTEINQTEITRQANLARSNSPFLPDNIPNKLVQPKPKPRSQYGIEQSPASQQFSTKSTNTDGPLATNPLTQRYGKSQTGLHQQTRQRETQSNDSPIGFKSQLPSSTNGPPTQFASSTTSPSNSNKVAGANINNAPVRTNGSLEPSSPGNTSTGNTAPGNTGPNNTGPNNTGPNNTGPNNTGPGNTAKQDDVVQPPGETVGPTTFQLASQPKFGDHWKHETPKTDGRAQVVPHTQYDFSPDPINQRMPYDAWEQIDVYQGKTLNATQRPLLEIGRPWYQLGQLAPGKTWFGATNLAAPQLIVFGDMRTAVSNIRSNGNDQTIWAFQANIDIDLKLTATERFHAFMGPLDRAGNATRFVYDDGSSFVSEFDPDVDFGYFEGDLGAIVGGYTGQTLPFDFPFAIGVMPLVFQNGVWMEDAILGAAFTVPARNSAALDISNMDTTFFAGFDKIDSPAFEGDDNAAKMYGVASFIEARNGYFELDYAYLEDRSALDRSYHNIGIGYTRRFGKLLSNSVRLITNAGQSSATQQNTADGFVFLVENSLITKNPSTFVPYANFWVGVDRPQSAARAGIAGGILRNTGILFESDNLTGFPTLDPTANDTYGGAIGFNILKTDFSQQLVLEAAMVEVMGNDPNRNAAGRQLGLGARYQLPLSNAVILRADAMVGFLQNSDNISGMRVELRHKF